MEHNRIVYTRPYDAEIEYLESTGTQWIDTGFFGNENTAMECEVLITDTSAEYVIAGSRASAGYNNISFLCAKNGSNYGFFVDFGSSVNNRFFVPYSRTNGYVILYTSKTDSKLTDVTIGNTYTNSNLVTGTIATPLTIKIGKTANGFNINHKNLSGRIKYFKLYNSNTLILNLIPVRVGTVGYMYDRVSKKLFGNQGTGNFILGQDVANPVPNIRRVFRFGNKRFVMPMPYDSRVEYLESTGTQYIYIPFTLNKGDNAYCSVCVTETELLNSNIIFMSSMNSKNKYGCVFLNRRIWFSSFSNNGVTGKNIYYDYNVWRNISIIYNASGNEYTFNVDNTNLASQTPAYNSASDIYLFCRNNLLEDAAKARISSLKIKRNGNYILDLIPVRRGNVGYMYDRVSGKLFGNSGTGQFILGNDIN